MVMDRMGPPLLWWLLYMMYVIYVINCIFGMAEYTFCTFGITKDISPFLFLMGASVLLLARYSIS